MEIPQELQQKLLSTQGELQSVKARIAAAEQSKRLAQLTSDQVAKGGDTNDVWSGVGRMFMKVSAEDFAKSAEKRQKELDDQISSLKKKEAYHATTLQKVVEAIQSL